MKIFLLTSFLMMMTLAMNAQAKSIVISDLNERALLYEHATVWEKPPWISDSFKFSSELNIVAGPKLKEKLALLHSDEVSCLTADEDQNYGPTGRNWKFLCQLLKVDPLTGERTPLFDKKGKRQTIKVKYTRPNQENPEVYAEVIASRLLWALGFGADAMYAVENVKCHGCAQDPFTERKVDPSTLENPRLFVRNAIEVKHPGVTVKFARKTSSGHDWIEQGWTFNELMNRLPLDPAEHSEALKQRQALRLLSIMIQHGDNKSVNQRIVCAKKDVVDGKCVGHPLFMIQDAGATFGLTDTWGKLDFARWVRDPIWKDPANCVAQFNFPQLPDHSVENAIINESGRILLALLLDGFSEGEAGRKRVEDLFLAAQMDKRQKPETVAMWTEAFLSKVEEIKYPLGRNHADFHCPQP